MKTVSTPVYSLIRPADWRLEIPLLIGFNLLLVLSAQVAIPLPFSPVPITGQTFGVLLVAMALGRLRGTSVVVAYFLEGALGLPVFAGGTAGLAVLMGPTGGYLIGFVFAAFLVGTLADHGWDRGIVRSLAAMTLGTAVIFAAGLAAVSRFVPSESVLALGLTPFVPGALIKIALASLVLPSVWRFVGRNTRK